MNNCIFVYYYTLYRITLRMNDNFVVLVDYVICSLSLCSFDYLTRVFKVLDLSYTQIFCLSFAKKEKVYSFENIRETLFFFFFAVATSEGLNRLAHRWELLGYNLLYCVW